MRETRVQVIASKEEQARWAKAAKASRLSLSSWLRNLAEERVEADEIAQELRLRREHAK